MTEGELEKRINEKTVHPAGIENYGSWILIENLDKIIEDTKKELFDSMVTHSEMHLHPIEDICGDKQWVRIPHQEYWQLMRHWIVLKKWFGEAK